MGTIVNAAAVVIGSAAGLLFRKKINADAGEAIVKVMGFCAMIMGLTGLIKTMAYVDGSFIEFNGSLMLIVCMALGAMSGEKLKIDDALNKIGAKLEARFNMSNFSSGFINASLIFCVGAMTIIGSFNDGINNDHSVLFLKSALDGVTSVFLAASMGYGVMFSALAILVLQGSMTLFAFLVKSAVTDIALMIGPVCMVGYAIVMLIGLNMMQAVKIKTANLLPALVFAVLWMAMGIKVI